VNTNINVYSSKNNYEYLVLAFYFFLNICNMPIPSLRPEITTFKGKVSDETTYKLTLNKLLLCCDCVRYFLWLIERSVDYRTIYQNSIDISIIMTLRYMLNIISALVIFNSILSKIVSAKHYRAHDPMPVIANTIGPYNNPTETYPVCVIINLFAHYYISYFFNYHVR